jgi:hypothetical protein
MQGHGIGMSSFIWVAPKDITNIHMNKIVGEDFNQRFCIVWANIASHMEELKRINNKLLFDLSDPYNKDVLLNHFKEMSNFFSHPRYFRIGNRPVVLMWLGDTLLNVEEVFDEIRKLYNPILFTTFAEGLDIEDTINAYKTVSDRLDYYDGVWMYSLYVADENYISDFIENTIQKYEIHKEHLSLKNKPLIPTVTVAFKKKNTDLPTLPHDVERFKDLLNISYTFRDPLLNWVNIPWNEWYEDNAIEPAIDFRFRYLEIIRKFYFET